MDADGLRVLRRMSKVVRDEVYDLTCADTAMGTAPAACLLDQDRADADDDVSHYCRGCLARHYAVVLNKLLGAVRE